LCLFHLDHAPGKFYRQVQGATRGFPLAALLANIFMTTFEVEAINFTPVNPKCWHKCLNNVFMVGNMDELPIRTPLDI
jgi:hypothetical protein